MDHPQIFLLSPAYCGGRRATALLKPRSEIPLATRLADGTLTLGEAFAFVSSLYFRGKLAYARAFGRVDPATCRGGSVYVITPTRGLQSPDVPVSPALLHEFASVDLGAGNDRYRGPLDRDLQALARDISDQTRVVLLGSIATGKYVDAVTAALGPQLHFPVAFVGRGDMSRGGLMLRSVAAGTELEYASLTPDVQRRGSRPPKLAPIARGGTRRESPMPIHEP